LTKHPADLRIAETTAAILEALEIQEGPLPPKKRALVEAAIHCFAEQGYDATSTREIAQRAGVAEATIFRHFPTKKDLLLRLVQPALDNIVVPAAQEQFEKAVADADGRIDEIIVPVLIGRVQFARRFFPLVRILLQELPLQEELRALLFAQLPKVFGEVGGLMQREIRAGRWTKRDPEQVMRQIGSMVIGYIVISSIFMPDRKWDDEAEIRAIVDTVLNGVRVR
jgi:AcrR family transcriptional regulator